MTRILCTDDACTAPGVKRIDDVWFCFFHPGKRPRIHAQTGTVYETPEEKTEREKRERQAKEAGRKPKAAVFDERDVVRRYQAGETIEAIRRDLRTHSRRISDALHDAGVEVRPKSRVLPLDEAEVARLYASGSSIGEVATQMHVSAKRVRATLVAARVELRPKGGSGRREVLALDPDDILARYARGQTIQQIARDLTVHQSRVSALLHERGVIRPGAVVRRAA